MSTSIPQRLQFIVLILFLNHYRLAAGRNCSKGMHTCGVNSFCIPEGWKCDGQKDCLEDGGSDELNCPKCAEEDYFECRSSGICISKRWRCDKKPDCRDASDEENCDYQSQLCKPGEWKCPISQECILTSRKCDGNFDCGDELDENDIFCSGQCPLRSDFNCLDDPKNPTCIPQSWTCDGNDDCPNAHDEKLQHCGNASCTASQFMCTAIRQCIANTSVCDGKRDCIDGTDEDCLDCDMRTEHKCARSFGHMAKCVPLERVCDRVPDCVDKSDENQMTLCKNVPIPASSNASFIWSNRTKERCAESVKCPDRSTCVGTYKGFYCKCNRGFQYNDTTKSCEDIDECATYKNRNPDTCPGCVNTIGSFNCTCNSGYFKTELGTCKPGVEKSIMPTGKRTCTFDPSADLLFAMRRRIRLSKLQYIKGKFTELFNDSTCLTCVGVDFDFQAGRIFWSDVTKENLYARNINETSRKAQPLLTRSNSAPVHNISTPDGIAFDWVHKNLYWTDTGLDTISVIHVPVKLPTGLDHYPSVTLIDKRATKDQVDQPRAIVVDPAACYMYWTDWGRAPKIERAGLDGSNREILVSNLNNSMNLGWPNGLTIDRKKQVLYWIDARLKQISSYDLKSKTVQIVVHNPKHFLHPFALDLFRDMLYFTDWSTGRIKAYVPSQQSFVNVIPPQNSNAATVSSTSSGGFATVFSWVPTGMMMDIKIYHSVNQPKAEYRCPSPKSSLQCSYICLPSPQGISSSNSRKYRCHCPPHKILSRDGHSCINIGASISAQPTKSPQATLGTGIIAGIVIVCLLLLFLIIGLVFYVLHRDSIRSHARRLGQMKGDGSVYGHTTVSMNAHFSASKDQLFVPLTEHDQLSQEAFHDDQ